MNSKVAKNYMYTSLFQISLLVLPFITLPYITRVLGSSGIGIHAFTNSIVQYFILFGSIGISLYGSREIAYVRDDFIKRNKVFWSIFYIKTVTAITSLLIFILIIIITSPEYKNIYLIQSMLIVGVAFDVSWLYAGMEDFKKIAIRNLIIRFVAVSSIFVFVKTQNQLVLYISILVCSELLGHVIMWTSIPQYISKSKIEIKDVKYHIKPILTLFISQIAIQAYVVMDKTILGLLSTKSQVGVYDTAIKLIKMSVGVITSLGTVMLPRMSNDFKKGNMSGILSNADKSFRFLTMVSVPMFFGMIGIAKELIPWLLNSEFSETIVLLYILGPIYVSITWSNVIGVQLMIPLGKNAKYISSVVIGAIISVSFNFLLIPHYHAVGAAVATLLAEFSIFIAQLILMRSLLHFKILFKDIGKVIVSSIIMFVCIRGIGNLLGVSYITTLVQIILGILIYTSSSLLLKVEISIILWNKIGFNLKSPNNKRSDL
ncbi:flippase [Paenibacillus sp. PAMC21692]|uniref:flippase n=1 Tax=Paenibacillus sp. PAMC21692 TaxID=2762320 RepID=UPI00164E350A|nr:flippase [Paenibacillus sp. PAMC21692]QNK58174.1 flippase [Paenibacillus sp. PAMC21692]